MSRFTMAMVPFASGTRGSATYSREPTSPASLAGERHQHERQGCVARAAAAAEGAPRQLEQPRRAGSDSRPRQLRAPRRAAVSGASEPNSPRRQTVVVRPPTTPPLPASARRSLPARMATTFAIGAARPRDRRPLSAIFDAGQDRDEAGRSLRSIAALARGETWGNAPAGHDPALAACQLTASCRRARSPLLRRIRQSRPALPGSAEVALALAWPAGATRTAAALRAPARSRS